MLANLDPGNRGGDRLEFTPNLPGRIHLQVEHVLMRWSARQENHDDGFVLAASTRERFGLEQLRQREPAQALQIVHHLLLFVLRLLRIVQVLPLATAAGAEVIAEGLRTVRRWRYDPRGDGFDEAALLLHHLHIGHIAGHRAPGDVLICGSLYLAGVVLDLNDELPD